MKQSRKRRSAKISDAVFRGKKGEYTFEVYPFAAEVPETAAIFILSRRKVHRTGHVSHAASCIGETGSIAAEVRKHRRAKCVKHNESNVVCILRDDSDKSRAAVVDDIAEARTFGCIRGVFEPTMMRKPVLKAPANGKALLGQVIPALPLPLKPVRRKRLEPVRKQETDEDKNTEPARESSRGNGKSAGTKRRAASAADRTKAAKPTKPAKSAKRSELAKPVKPTKPAKLAGSVEPAKPAKSAKATAPTSKKGSMAKTGTKRTRVAAVAAKPKRIAAKPRARVQGGVDRDRGKHRLPNQAGTVRGRAKAGTAKRAGTRKKAAA